MGIVKYSFFLVVVGAMSTISPSSFAEETEYPVSFSLGLGKARSQQAFDITGLTSQGYTINSYKKDKEDEQSIRLGVSYKVSETFSLSANLLNLGEVSSTLDAEIPEGKTARQAAEDIVGSSPQQAGGLMVTFGGQYIQPINPRLDLRLGAGVLFGQDKHAVTINDELVEIDESLSAPYLKVGVGVKVRREVTVTAYAERYYLDNAVERYEVGFSYSY